MGFETRQLTGMLAVPICIVASLLCLVTPWPSAWFAAGVFALAAAYLVPRSTKSSPVPLLRLVIAGLLGLGLGSYLILVEPWNEPVYFVAIATAGTVLLLAAALVTAGRHFRVNLPAASQIPSDLPLLALLLMLLGVLGIAFAGIELVQKIVVIAPLFEESWKLGIALVWYAGTRMRHSALLPILGLMSGIAFGVFEHQFTYWDETPLAFGRRVAFHGATGALSAAWFAAMQPGIERSPAIGWAAPVPAMLFHATNNALAIVLPQVEAWVAFAFLPLLILFFVLPVPIAAFAIVTWLRPQLAQMLTVLWWVRLKIPIYWAPSGPWRP
jgi:hypothetical protein